MATAAVIPFKGVPVYLNGQQYYIAALSLKQFEDNYEALSQPVPETETGGLKAQFERYVPIILQAIQRNHPEVTSENLYEWLDLGTFRDVFLIVQGASGLKPVAPGE